MPIQHEPQNQDDMAAAGKLVVSTHTRRDLALARPAMPRGRRSPPV
jgi:hypothetical protein